MIEIWKSIINYENLYEISNFGQIKSFSRPGNWHEKILKLNLKQDGYSQITLWKNRIPKTFLVHRLVLETFIGPCPMGMECRHIDNNRSNNQLNNLQWNFPSENRKDIIKYGTIAHQKGVLHGMAKLTNDDVREIRDLLIKKELKQVEIAKRFNVSFQTISSIKLKKSWGHL